MFTMDGYGDDLGGTWGNGDTSLKELEVTGGTLSPSFDGETTSYALTLDGGDVSVTPTAANEKISWSRHLSITKPRPTMWSTIAVVKIYRSSQETPFTSVWANTSGRP